MVFPNIVPTPSLYMLALSYMMPRTKWPIPRTVKSGSAKNKDVYVDFLTESKVVRLPIATISKVVSRLSVSSRPSEMPKNSICSKNSVRSFQKFHLAISDSRKRPKVSFGPKKPSKVRKSFIWKLLTAFRLQKFHLASPNGFLVATHQI